jgi:hypothetical protein
MVAVLARTGEASVLNKLKHLPIYLTLNTAVRSSATAAKTKMKFPIWM